MSHDQANGAAQPSLAEEQGQLTRSRIQRAAMEVVARRGFDAKVEEIAEVSGVSPRTVYRHYQTQDRLIAATLKDMFEASSLPVEDLPSLTEDFDAWLEALAVVVHSRNAEIIGNAFWDLQAPNHKLTGELAELVANRREFRHRAMDGLCALA
jgi:AcrR family transcriptional regulator